VSEMTKSPHGHYRRFRERVTEEMMAMRCVSWNVKPYCWRRGSVVRTSVFGWQAFSDL